MAIFRMLIIQYGVLCALAGYAQKEIEIPVSHRVVMNFQEYIVYADILASERKFKPKSGKYYFWYNANDIKRTRGGYDGKLLHGSYTEFFPDKNLRQKGMFRYGLKKGVWKTWYHSGELESVMRWKKGVRQGWFKYYDETGKLVKQGSHKDDLMHGKIDTFLSDGSRERLIYVNGLKKAEKSGRAGKKKSPDNREKNQAKNKKEGNKKKEAVETEVKSDEKLKKKAEGPAGEKSQKVSKEKPQKPDTSEKKPEGKKKKATDRDQPKSDQKTTPQGD